MLIFQNGQQLTTTLIQCLGTYRVILNGFSPLVSVGQCEVFVCLGFAYIFFIPAFDFCQEDSHEVFV